MPLAMMSAVEVNEPIEITGPIIVKAWECRHVRSPRVVSYTKHDKAAPRLGTAALFVVDTNPQPRRNLLIA